MRFCKEEDPEIAPVEKKRNQKDHPEKLPPSKKMPPHEIAL